MHIILCNNSSPTIKWGTPVSNITEHVCIFPYISEINPWICFILTPLATLVGRTTTKTCYFLWYVSPLLNWGFCGTLIRSPISKLTAFISPSKRYTHIQRPFTDVCITITMECRKTNKNRELKWGGQNWHVQQYKNKSGLGRNERQRISPRIEKCERKTNKQMRERGSPCKMHRLRVESKRDIVSECRCFMLCSPPPQRKLCINQWNEKPQIKMHPIFA